MRPQPALLLLVVVPTAACAHVVDSPRPPDWIPLIEAILVAGSDVSRFRLRWLDPADQEVRSPILPEDVRLDLRAADGARATWEPDPDSSGMYLAALPITAQGRYQLGGTIDGGSITAVTRVPGPLDIEQPAGDTLFVSADPGAAGSPQSGRIVVRWRADGATVLALDSAAVRFGARFTHAGEADLGVRQSAAGQRIGPTIRFVAMNRDGDRYHFNLSGPETNIAGGFGVFGGAAETRRTVVWR